jgi:GTP-binding protein
MAKCFKVALVGRPNVGKSALFNRMVGRRIAIVNDEEGVTRDRLYARTELFGRPVEIIDTGGITKDAKVPFFEEIKEQTLLAIEEADSLVMVVDSSVGLTQFDEEVAKLLHRTKKPVYVAVNKIDHPSFESRIAPFYSLGFSEVIGVSAEQGFHIAELLEMALATMSTEEEDVEEETRIKVAIIGRPNVGKSTLLNYILGESRCVVSDIPGTTRDAIDIPLDIGEQRYLLIDTAGIRRKKGEKEVIDKFAALRTEKAMERADVCLLVFDATEGLTIEEKRILTTIEEKGKGCILVANKWDLLKEIRMEHCAVTLRKQSPFTEHFPLMFTSALTGRNLSKIFEEVQNVYSHLHQRIGTGELNRFIERAIQKYHPPMIQGKRLRIYYLTQKAGSPPEFILFINRVDLMTKTYERYLVKSLREYFNFSGVPIRFKLQGKSQQQAKKAVTPAIQESTPEEEMIEC